MPLKNLFPAYIVSNDGKDIQEFFTWIQDTLEKQGIGSLLEIIKTLFDILKAQIKSYALLDAFEDILNKLTALLKELAELFPHRD